MLPPGLVLATQGPKQEQAPKQEQEQEQAPKQEPTVVLKAATFADLARQIGGGSVVPKVPPAGGAVAQALPRDAEDDPWGDAEEYGAQQVAGEP